MGIGRREFLKLTGIALAGVVIDPLQSTITNKNIYINRKLGIMFSKPSLWNFIHVKDFGKLKKKQILADEWEEYKDEVWEDLGDPICVATKFDQANPKYKGFFSPTVTLNITPKNELDDLESKNFDEIYTLSENATSHLLKGFKVTQRYDPFYISGCRFIEKDAEYLFEHAELESPIMVEMKHLGTEHGNFYYDFNFHQSTMQNQIAQKEFEELKKSIVLI